MIPLDLPPEQVYRDEQIADLLSEGLILYAPEINEIQVDWDSANLIEFWQRFHLLKALYNQKRTFRAYHTLSKSGNWHIRIRVWWFETGTLVQLSDAERIAYACTLGSDWKREMMNLRRVWRGETPNILLAETAVTVEYLASQGFTPYKSDSL